MAEEDIERSCFLITCRRTDHMDDEIMNFIV